METIAFYPRDIALTILGISSAQLRRDQRVLLSLNVEGFDYNPRDIGFSDSAFHILVAFRVLVNQQGRRRAICQIGSLSAQEIDQLITVFQADRTNSFPQRENNHDCQ